MSTENTQTPATDPIKDSLFKSLKLTVTQAPEPSKASEEPKRTPSGDIIPEEIPEPENRYSVSDGSLIGVLADIRDKKQAPAETPPPAAPATTPPAEGVKPPAEPAATTPPAVEVKKKAPTVLQAPEQVPDIVPAPAATPTPPVQSDPSDEELTDEEKEEIELARFAAAANPEKYLGLDAKTKAFFKKHNEYLDKRLSEDPHFEADVSKNEEYRRWVEQNRVQLPRGERKELERKMLVQQAKQEAARESDAKLKAVNEKLREIELRPKIQQSVTEFSSALRSQLPEDIATSVKAGTLADELPVEAPIVENYLNLADKAASEFLHLTQGLTKYDPSNQIHSWLGGFIQEQGTIFLKKGGKDLEREGKKFIPRAEYAGLPEAKRSSYWTFSDSDVLNMLVHGAKDAIETAVTAERQKLEKALAAREKRSGKPAAPPVSKPTGTGNDDVSPRAAAAPVAPLGSSPAVNQRDPLMAKILGKT